MVSTTPDTIKRNLHPRTAIIGGAALGLVVGATVYGAVSSSADAQLPQVFKAKAPVTVTPVIAAGCAGVAKLENGVCVVHVVRTVMAPVAPAAAAPAAPLAGQAPTNTLKPGTTAGGAVVAPKPTVTMKALAARTLAPAKAPVPAPVPAVAPAARTTPATAPTPGATPTTASAPGATPKPASTPVPTAAS